MPSCIIQTPGGLSHRGLQHVEEIELSLNGLLPNKVMRHAY
jgi:hypothetical protein